MNDIDRIISLVGPRPFAFALLGLALIILVITIWLISILTREKVPEEYPQAAIGGVSLRPIPSVKIARFVEEGRGGAIQMELAENPTRFHIYLYEVRKNGKKPYCRYRRRLLVDPGANDVRSFAYVKDKKANAFAIVEDPEKGHLHIGVFGLLLSSIFMGIGSYFVMDLIAFGFLLLRREWVIENGAEYVEGIVYPSFDTWIIILSAAIFLGLFTFFVTFSVNHEGRRARK